MLIVSLLTLLGVFFQIRWLAGAWQTDFEISPLATPVYIFIIALLIIAGLRFATSARVRFVIEATFILILLLNLINLVRPHYLINQSVTSSVFVVASCVALFAKAVASRRLIVLHLISTVGLVIALFGLIGFLGYVFGSAFFSVNDKIGLSFNSCIGFFLLGLVMLGLGGSRTIFAKPFMGVSSSALVLRVFLPLIVAGILFEGVLFVLFTHYLTFNPTIVLAVLKSISIVLTAIVIMFVSRFVFKRADEADRERRKSEEIVERERILLRTLIDHLPDTIYVKDQDARKILANHADLKAIGVEREDQVLGRTDLELFQSDDGRHGFEEDQQVLQTGKAILNFENSYHDKNNQLVWLLTSKIPLHDTYGKVVGLVGIGHNITEQKEREAQMLLFNHSMKSLNDSVSITDTNDTIIFVNESFTRIYGYTKEEVIGKNIQILRSVSTAAEADFILEATMQSGWQGEIENRRKDGSLLHVLLSTSPVKNEKGEIVALLGIATDITERKQMEKALEESEKKFRDLIQNQGEGLGVIDMNEMFVFSNPAAEQIFEVQEGGLSGHPLSEFLTQDAIRNMRKELRTMHQREKKTFEVDLITPTQNIKCLLFTTTLKFDDTAKQIGTFGIFRDITSQKKAEQEIKRQKEFLETIIESLNHPFYVVNTADYSVLLANSAANKLPNSPTQTCYSLTHGFTEPCEKAEILCPMQQCVETGKSVSLEQVFNQNNENISCSEIHAYPVFNDKGDVVQVIEYSLDITERKKIEHQLARQTEELLELNSTKDKFFSIIAHDLRSPFNAMLGLSELLATSYYDFDDAMRTESVNDIYQASKQAFGLLENLLEWARAQTGKIEFLPSKFKINGLVHETFSVVSSSAENKHIHLKVTGNEEIVAFADRNMIYTIMRNLVTNAIKFTPENGNITLSIIENQDDIQFSVADTGLGISEENIGKLFRIDKTFSKLGTAQEKGTGLGLILCKEFVDKHGGTISVESKLNVGSIFTVTLPKMKA